MAKSFIEQSKITWEPSGDRQASTEELILGCQQRIATATEAMASNYIKMQNDLDMYKRWYNQEAAKRDKMAKQIAAYQGHIKRMKKKAANT